MRELMTPSSLMNKLGFGGGMRAAMLRFCFGMLYTCWAVWRKAWGVTRCKMWCGMWGAMRREVGYGRT